MSAHTFRSLSRRSLSRQAAIASISAYQRHFSPRKGFDCPHRIVYGESCSDAVKRLLGEQSLLAAVQMTPGQFRACKSAAAVLQTDLRRQSGCIVIPCCIPI